MPLSIFIRLSGVAGGVRTSLILRLLIAGTLVVIPALACNFGAAAPTPAVPAVTLAAPLLTVRPVTGPPGMQVTLEGAGFTPNATLSLFLTNSSGQGSPFAAAHADQAGNVYTVLTLPSGFGTASFANGSVIVFTLTTADSQSSASALFLVEGSGTQVAPGSQITPVDQSTAAPVTSGVFITEPALNSLLAGSSVTVAGSAPAGNVTVEVQDINNTVLGSAQATSVMGVGQTIGTWQTTIAFTQPANTASGYIVVQAAGQQASIPVTFNGSAVPSLAASTLNPSAIQP